MNHKEHVGGVLHYISLRSCFKTLTLKTLHVFLKKKKKNAVGYIKIQQFDRVI